MGKVYLVGAGPGDAELLTIKAVKVISKADVILYDRLINEEVLEFAPKGCRHIYVGKSDGKHTLPQEEINRLLVKSASLYPVVVRLKGGDPFVFGRGAEEAVYLARHGIEFEVIPGVSSLYAVPAYAGIPVTFRKVASSFAVVTGHEATGKEKNIDWKAFKDVDTLVVLMGVKNRKFIGEQLISIGRNPEEPVAFIERGTTSSQRVVLTTLGELATSPPPVNPPAVMVVGEVVKVHRELKEFLGNLKELSGVDAEVFHG